MGRPLFLFNSRWLAVFYSPKRMLDIDARSCWASADTNRCAFTRFEAVIVGFVSHRFLLFCLLLASDLPFHRLPVGLLRLAHPGREGTPPLVGGIFDCIRANLLA